LQPHLDKHRRIGEFAVAQFEEAGAQGGGQNGGQRFSEEKLERPGGKRKHRQTE